MWKMINQRAISVKGKMSQKANRKTKTNIGKTFQSIPVIRKISEKISDVRRRTKWHFQKESYESVYFFTLHKCASSLFSSFVLRHLEGLRHIDYERQVADGIEIGQPVFEDYGYVYGPIRTPGFLKGPYKATAVEGFIKDKTSIIFIRDPRDILVSQYYSFGWSHAVSSDPKIREGQIRKKESIRAKTLDQYVLENSNALLIKYMKILALENLCKKATTIKYEDMIYNYDQFLAQLTKVVTLRSNLARRIYARTRPQDIEDIHVHRRSGKSGEFKDKLHPNTIASLNETFQSVLSHYSYNN